MQYLVQMKLAVYSRNNPKKKRRAPTFDEAKFPLNAAEQTIDIKLIY